MARGTVSVSVQTHQSNGKQRHEALQYYTVDESGATLNALSRKGGEEERAAHLLAEQESETPAASIFIRDLKLSGRLASIRFDDSSFWFNPVANVEDTRHHPRAPDSPCGRGDIFLKLGMRGCPRRTPWRLREGDVFRLGQAYVRVKKVRLESDQPITNLSPLQAVDPAAAAPSSPPAAAAAGAAAPGGEGAWGAESQGSSEGDGAAEEPHECYICYEAGAPGNPLISPCKCTGSVKYVHLNCLQRYLQPEGSATVHHHCSICKTKYPEEAQEMMIRAPALLLEAWCNHRTLRRQQWVSFTDLRSVSLGRFAEHNDVVIPDHSVSAQHAWITRNKDEFWLHDRRSPG